MHWPDVLIEDLARRRTVLMLGSGVSRHALNDALHRPPTWKSFLEQALVDAPAPDTGAIAEAIDSNDLLHACEWLKAKYDEHWIPYLRKIFSEPGYQPGELHKQILNLDSRVVFSLNFDTIYERCAQNIKSGSHVIRQYYDRASTEYLRGKGRYIVKVHGSIDAAERLIFNQKDYAEARIKYGSFYKSFDAALMTHTFLFIGAGYADPDVNLILENQAFSFPTASPHYILRPNGGHNEIKESLRQNRNLKTLEYDPIDNDHKGLIDVIVELNKAVEDARLDLSRTNNW